MNDQPRQVLVGLVQRYGPELAEDPRRVKALLNDFCGDSTLEVNLLAAAHEDGVPHALRTAARGIPKQALVSQMTARLHDDKGLAYEFAYWAVVSRALALGLLSRAEMQAVERAGPPPPPSGGGTNPRAPGARGSTGPPTRVVVPETPAGAIQLSSIRDLPAVFGPEVARAGQALASGGREVGRKAAHVARVLTQIGAGILEVNPVALVASIRRLVNASLAGGLALVVLGALAGAMWSLGALVFAQLSQGALRLVASTAANVALDGALAGATATAVPGLVFGAVVQAYDEFGDPGAAVMGSLGGFFLGGLIQPLIGVGWPTGLGIGWALGSLLSLAWLSQGPRSHKRTVDRIGGALWIALRRLARGVGWTEIGALGLGWGIIGALAWLALDLTGFEPLVSAQIVGTAIGLCAGAVGPR